MGENADTPSKPEIPSNTGTHVARQWETMEDKGRHGETRPQEGGRHPTKGNKQGHNGRQGETRPREGGHTIQQKETRRETREKNLGKAEGGHLKKALYKNP